MTKPRLASFACGPEMGMTSRRLLRCALGVWLASATGARAGSGAEVAAQDAERQAFAAIEAERWCDALHYFVVANSAAPSLDLIWNAAQAADLAGDRKRALKLYVELLGAYPRSKKQRKVNGRVKTLTAQIAKKGGGVRCEAPAEPAQAPEEPVPPLAPPPDTAAAGATPPGEVSAPAARGTAHAAGGVDDAPAPPASPDASTLGTAPPPAHRPPESPEPAEPAAVASAPTPSPAPGPSGIAWPWAVTTTGIVLGLGGPVAAIAGALPYFDYVSANGEIRAAETAGLAPGEVAALQERQSQSLAAWHGWGQGAALAGGLVASVGIVTTVAGVVWALSQPVAEEEQP